ncbi:hypothetical protein DTO166G4_592 [Paecilomyces variotii]|uniref:Kinase-like domain-containing protein n=1 Tax=Byssochlamys spectabilis TaxID=264951 RepID=A0A443HL33_BYSSP|nr:kinase-like domain-containing protein [Paecilomyces variotii]KAJ9193565.1 hypothetical protein DTO164E3_7821 [Paecilomyces variotii]KAJ9217788.1 hypothetical protein DTO166G4_592 [Paecilomyces variotii]KAJ9219348.1 hypothetical protein DTO169C6_8320 [Paecilomyces variotii]KAJ9228018.1 hypothetical protein DTO166G5_8910 [Paecilomyces variotii]KAJ9234573.1 hypothetical protein DTO169E5_6524 [Paecilomyces variotii]
MGLVKKSKAARFNAHTLKLLQAAVKQDPEVDLTTKLPTRYSDRLDSMRNSERPDHDAPVPHEEEDIRASLRASDSVETIFPLSERTLSLIRDQSRGLQLLPDSFPQQLVYMIQESDILWSGPFPRQKMVFKCNSYIVLKAVRDMTDYTEYTTLQYLQQHKSNIPVPEPLGLLRMNGISLMFMSYLHGDTLTAQWAMLNPAQKTSVKEQLNQILLDLRSLPFPPGRPLGGVGGEGCKDVRRHLRRNDRPVMNVDDFEDFLFSSPRSGGHVFVELLRGISPSPSSSKIVFTHGDIRPDNIVVEVKDGGDCIITGIIDWEYSGFYPDYYEAIKCTNCLSPYEENDWFLFLPGCVSLERYPHWWLLDRVRESRVI